MTWLDDVRENPRRYRRVILVVIVVGTWWVPWGSASLGCNVGPSLPMPAPAEGMDFASPRAALMAFLAALYLSVPFLAPRLGPGSTRLMLHLVGTAIAGFLAFSMVAAGLFAQALFGRVQALTLAGFVGVSACVLGVLEAFSWVVIEFAESARGRRPPVASGTPSSGARSEFEESSSEGENERESQ